jgi:NADPH:quinone reductase-like Zn-dependent oxidoreductase
VEAVGPQVTDLRPGNEVFGSLWGSTARTRPGTFAEYAVAPGSQVVRKAIRTYSVRGTNSASSSRAFAYRLARLAGSAWRSGSCRCPCS